MLKFFLILIIVLIFHVGIIFYPLISLIGPQKSKEHSKNVIEISLIKPKPKRIENISHDDGEGTGSGLSFKDLAIGRGDNNVVVGKDSSGGGGLCLNDLIQGIGDYPDSFFHKELTGSAAIKIHLSKNEISFKSSYDDNWMISGLLCYRLKERFEKIKKSSCLKKLSNKNYSFLYRLSLKISADENDNLDVLSDGNYHRQITKMSKQSPVQILKVATNLLSVVDFFETKSDAREWNFYQNLLTRFDCNSSRVRIN